MVDIMPTIIDRMGLPMPPVVEGKSLLKVSTDAAGTSSGEGRL